MLGFSFFQVLVNHTKSRRRTRLMYVRLDIPKNRRLYYNNIHSQVYKVFSCARCPALGVGVCLI